MTTIDGRAPVAVHDNQSQGVDLLMIIETIEGGCESLPNCAIPRLQLHIYTCYCLFMLASALSTLPQTAETGVWHAICRR